MQSFINKWFFNIKPQPVKPTPLEKDNDDNMHGKTLVYAQHCNSRLYSGMIPLTADMSEWIRDGFCDAIENNKGSYTYSTFPKDIVQDNITCVDDLKNVLEKLVTTETTYSKNSVILTVKYNFYTHSDGKVYDFTEYKITT